MKPLYIFDLDGTISNAEHRQHLVQCEKPDWTAFYAACHLDAPQTAVIGTMAILKRHADIWIFSGRSEEVRDKTHDWIEKHAPFLLFRKGGGDADLIMRSVGDYTPDDQLKESWYDNMLLDDKSRLVAVFDDRDRVVAMWRRKNVPCFQVAPGAF